MSKKPKLETWSSRFGFVMAATGAAVGLGSFWLFPFNVGQYGGSAFVLVYLLCVIIVGVPALAGEIILGKITKKNPIAALQEISDKYKSTKLIKLIGIMGIISLFMVLSFYSVAAGWSVAYTGYAILGEFNSTNHEIIQNIWLTLINSPKSLLFYHSLFMFATMYIVNQGVKKGIEFASKLMMPTLFFILLALVAHSSTTTGFTQAIDYLFSFDSSKLTNTVILAAIGQAFFNLALGAGCMLVYGCYIPKGENVGSNVTVIAIINTVVSLLAGLAIFPLVFSYNLEPASGPGLMFLTLPIAFAQMKAGYIIGIAFFVLLLFAAITSSISLAEPLVMLVSDKLKYSRKKSSIIIGIAAWACGINALLSFNVLSDVKIMGKYTFFEILIGIPSNIFLPLGVLGFSLVAGWIIPRKISKEHLGFKCKHIYNAWLFSVRYIAPLCITVVILSNLI